MRTCALWAEREEKYRNILDLCDSGQFQTAELNSNAEENANCRVKAHIYIRHCWILAHQMN